MFFFLKLFLNYSFKFVNITLDPDSNWAKILDPESELFLTVHWVRYFGDVKAVRETPWGEGEGGNLETVK